MPKKILQKKIASPMLIHPTATVSLVMSKMLQWRFEKIGGTWYWTAGEHTTTTGPFPSFISCLVDAQERGLFAQGYEPRKVPVAPLPAIERRPVGKKIPEVLFAPMVVGH
jgi:hypothetical protein